MLSHVRGFKIQVYIKLSKNMSFNLSSYECFLQNFDKFILSI